MYTEPYRRTDNGKSGLGLSPNHGTVAPFAVVNSGTPRTVHGVLSVKLRKESPGHFSGKWVAPKRVHDSRLAQRQ
jgi:hypothetical protein